MPRLSGPRRVEQKSLQSQRKSTENSLNSKQLHKNFVTSELDIETEINSRVEQKVNQRLKELTNNILKTKQFEEAVSDRFALVENRIIEKLQKVHRNESVKDKENTQTESAHLEALKESTMNDILFLLNNGSLKSLMTLKMIGKKRAEAILESRKSDGEYKELVDLTRIGLKQSQISSIFKANLDIG
jgi:DNA uptake protein ComE-like DNA-binding protein